MIEESRTGIDASVDADSYYERPRAARQVGAELAKRARQQRDEIESCGSTEARLAGVTEMLLLGHRSVKLEGAVKGEWPTFW